jgi:hypothetical protein
VVSPFLRASVSDGYGQIGAGVLFAVRSRSTTGATNSRPLPPCTYPRTDLIAVQRLRPGRAAGPSGLKIEDIKVWVKDLENNPEPWNKFLRLVKHCFVSGALFLYPCPYCFVSWEVPKATCFSTLVLIPKASRGVPGIGLLESVWKVISMIIKLHLDEGVALTMRCMGFVGTEGLVLPFLRLDYKLITASNRVKCSHRSF